MFFLLFWDGGIGFVVVLGRQDLDQFGDDTLETFVFFDLFGPSLLGRLTRHTPGILICRSWCGAAGTPRTNSYYSY
jgi:hypothetical protein